MPGGVHSSGLLANGVLEGKFQALPWFYCAIEELVEIIVYPLGACSAPPVWRGLSYMLSC